MRPLKTNSRVRPVSQAIPPSGTKFRVDHQKSQRPRSTYGTIPVSQVDSRWGLAMGRSHRNAQVGTARASLRTEEYSIWERLWGPSGAALAEEQPLLEKMRSFDSNIDAEVKESRDRVGDYSSDSDLDAENGFFTPRKIKQDYPSDLEENECDLKMYRTNEPSTLDKINRGLAIFECIGRGLRWLCCLPIKAPVAVGKKTGKAAKRAANRAGAVGKAMGKAVGQVPGNVVKAYRDERGSDNVNYFDEEEG